MRGQRGRPGRANSRDAGTLKCASSARDRPSARRRPGAGRRSRRPPRRARCSPAPPATGRRARGSVRADSSTGVGARAARVPVTMSMGAPRSGGILSGLRRSGALRTRRIAPVSPGHRGRAQFRSERRTGPNDERRRRDRDHPCPEPGSPTRSRCFRAVRAPADRLAAGHPHAPRARRPRGAHAKIVADHLRGLGLDVRTGVGGTGVVACCAAAARAPSRPARRHGRPARPRAKWTAVRVEGARATERRARSASCTPAVTTRHVAILMASAEVLAGLRGRPEGRGQVHLPAGRGDAARRRRGRRAADGRARARSRIRCPSAIFGLHVTSRLPVGRSATGRADHGSADTLPDPVRGRQTHGAAPWLRRRSDRDRGAGRPRACRPSSAAQVDIASEPAVVTIGMIRGGMRENIIPDRVEMRGTIRAFDRAMRDEIHERVTTLAESVARGSRAGCTVCIDKNYPVTVNDPALTAAMVPTLARVAGEGRFELRAQGDRRGGLLVLPARHPGPVLLRRRDAARERPGRRVRQPFAALLHRRAGLGLGVRSLAQLACDWLEANAAGRLGPRPRGTRHGERPRP